MPQNKLFKVPEVLPNDLEGFCFYYPKKFPLVRVYFEETIKRIFNNPPEFKKVLKEQKEELFKGFYKIRGEYVQTENKDIALKIKTDQRLHKLFCFRFWIINYGMCDGPLHKYYVERLKKYSDLVADWEDLEEKSDKILKVERALLQGDYGDFYMDLVLKGIKIHEILKNSKVFQREVLELKFALEIKDNKLAYEAVEKILQKIKVSETEESNQLNILLKYASMASNVRADNLGLYNAIMQAFQFSEKNLQIKKRHENMKKEVQEVFEFAKSKLSEEDYKDLKICYDMSNLLKWAKDVFGELDGELLPFWFGMLYEVAAEYKIPNPMMGHAGSFYELVWYLPPDLKALVYTPDYTEFNLEKL